MRPKTSNRHLYIKKKGRLPGAALKRKVITPASLDDYLVGVLRVFQLHLELQSDDTHRIGDREPIL